GGAGRARRRGSRPVGLEQRVDAVPGTRGEREPGEEDGAEREGLHEAALVVARLRRLARQLALVPLVPGPSPTEGGQDRPRERDQEKVLDQPPGQGLPSWHCLLLPFVVRRWAATSAPIMVLASAGRYGLGSTIELQPRAPLPQTRECGRRSPIRGRARRADRNDEGGNGAIGGAATPRHFRRF